MVTINSYYIKSIQKYVMRIVQHFGALNIMEAPFFGRAFCPR